MGTLVERYEDLLVRIVGEAREVYGARLVAVAVYGSVGRGTMREDSDIDLLIVARHLGGRTERWREFDPVETRMTPLLQPRVDGAMPILLSPVIKTPEEVELGSPLFLDMTQDARILWDPEGFLAGCLDRLRERLRERGARRIPWKGAWYWDLDAAGPSDDALGATVTNESLAESYVKKCALRLEVLALLLERGGHSDVVREAQELVELALKAMVRAVGVDPPKQHDVGDLLMAHARRFSPAVREHLPRAAEISKRLRKDGELAFYGDVDFIPTVEYTESHGREAYEGAAWVFELARRAVSEQRA